MGIFSVESLVFDAMTYSKRRNSCPPQAFGYASGQDWQSLLAQHGHFLQNAHIHSEYNDIHFYMLVMLRLCGVGVTCWQHKNFSKISRFLDRLCLKKVALGCWGFFFNPLDVFIKNVINIPQLFTKAIMTRTTFRMKLFGNTVGRENALTHYLICQFWVLPIRQQIKI